MNGGRKKGGINPLKILLQKNNIVQKFEMIKKLH
jgi:hypothetical protein